MATDKNEPLFNTGAVVYDTFRFLHAPAERTAAHADLSSGDTVLDVACGSGRTTIEAARIVGPGGRVIGIDIADKLLDIARQKSFDTGYSNIEFMIGRAESLGFPDDRFDAVTCASSLFLFSDMTETVRECFRVLKPGARVVFSVFGRDIFQPISGMIDVELEKFGIDDPKVPVSAITDSPAKCSDIMFDAGIYDFEIVTENLGLPFESAEECWRQIANSLIVRPRLAGLEREHYQELKRKIIAELETIGSDTGITVEVPVLFIKAEKPFDLRKDNQ